MQRNGIWLFIAGALLVLLSVLLGNSLQSELSEMPLARLLEEAQGMRALQFFGFAFGFPLGIGLSALGAMRGSETSLWRLLLFFSVTCIAAVSAGLVPLLWGRELSASFFGLGGYLLMLLVLASIWLWGLNRSRLAPHRRLAADLQGLGYLCFAMAAWNLCGAASMPAFALQPERMLNLGTQGFAVGQMKSIMLLFILGWLCSLLGYWQTGKQS